jgi:mono/diheme cytochrome c family protein
MLQRKINVLSGAILASAMAVSAPALAEDLSGYTGATLFKHYCAGCHGAEGRGDGPVAPSLKVEVPDLTRITARHGGQFPTEQIRKIIDGRMTVPPHGPRDMPVWGQAFKAAGGSDKLIGLLTEYLRSIQVRSEK